MTRIAIDVRKIADFGIGTYIRGLLGGLAELDQKTSYLLLGAPSSSERIAPLPANFQWVAETSPGYSVRELWSVSWTLRRCAADLFHSPHYVLPLRLPCPAVVTVHDLIHLRFPQHRSALERVYARWTIARALRTAKRTITDSRATSEEIVASFGSGAALVTIALGVNDEFRQRPGAAEQADGLARLGLDPGYLLFVGNPKPHKNLDLLVDAHARLARRRDDTPFLVIAGGASRAAGQSSTKVCRLGRVDADLVPALYRGALALVVPSLWEGFGLPAAEAMACGTPVIAADRGALPEVVGGDALLFDPTSAEELIGCIERLLDEPSLRRQLAERGPARVDRLRWRTAAKATLAVYHEVLDQERRSRR